MRKVILGKCKALVGGLDALREVKPTHHWVTDNLDSSPLSIARGPADGNRNQHDDLKAYRINAFTVILPRDTCFQPPGEG
jgi:hypothetical protein